MKIELTKRQLNIIIDCIVGREDEIFHRKVSMTESGEGRTNEWWDLTHEMNRLIEVATTLIDQKNEAAE